MRPDLFIQKIKQCTVVFDFSDASAELREKEIKRQTLQEILEHISMNRGVLTENVYPEIVNMVSFLPLFFTFIYTFYSPDVYSLPSIFSALSLLKWIQRATHLIQKKMSQFWN